MTFLRGFAYIGDVLHAGSVPLERIAETEGTPAYVYNLDAIRLAYEEYRDAFSPWKHLACYAVKANSTAAVLRTLEGAEAGFDVNSAGELFRVLRAGADPQKVVMTGVGKTNRDIEAGVDAGILLFNAESVEECLRINAVARDRGSIAQALLRINPDVPTDTHPGIATGSAEHKFGISQASAMRALPDLSSLPNLRIAGFGMHLGSMLFEAGPYAAGLKMLTELADVSAGLLSGSGRFLNIGGGIGVPYKAGDPVFPAAELASDLSQLLDGLRARGVVLLSEPGRCIVANSGVLLTRVEYVNKERGRVFLIIDAGMNDLLRPMLYAAHHEILPVRRRSDRDETRCEIAGPVCESTDVFATARTIREVKPGELLAICSAGAYGASMSSVYNSRPLAVEVAVSGGKRFVARRRQTFEQLVENETAAP